MASTHTLVAMFESDKATLEKELAGLTLPKDGEKIQKVVTTYFDTLFNKEGEFRQNLTLGEDYILQAALSLLNAQQEIARKLSEQTASQEVEQKTEKKEEPVIPNQKPLKKLSSIRINGQNALLGAGGGALLGQVVWSSGWGAVFGAIAGTALVLYMATQENSHSDIKRKCIEAIPASQRSVQDCSIDVDSFLEVVKQTCESIDTLITTFRNQIKRVVDKYESQEKPTLENEYSLLLESIQSLLGVAYSGQSDEKRLKKIDERIEQLVDSLGNYELEVISYDNEQKNLFDELSSDKVAEPTMVCPAILKKGIVVKKGKVFINSK